jgi:hypothetical protein
MRALASARGERTTISAVEDYQDEGEVQGKDFTLLVTRNPKASRSKISATRS